MWTACTNRDELRIWFGEVSGELRQGATVRLEIGVPHKLTCRILLCEPPHRLLVTWWYEGFSAEHVDHRITPHGEGEWTELTLEHRSNIKAAFWAGVGPGWESWLFRLTALLAGDDSPRSLETLEARSGSLWKAVVACDTPEET